MSTPAGPTGRPDTPDGRTGPESPPWPSTVRDVLGGDLVVALAYRTPASGAVVVPVSTFGIHDEQTATVTFTSTFGAGKKLQRIAADSRVALAYHTRQHGNATAPAYVLIQGRASFPDRPDRDFLDRLHAQRWDRFAPPRRHGPLWDRLTREYHDLRVPVTVHITRISVWPDLAPTGQPHTIIGQPRPDDPPEPQAPPAGGTAPRVKASKYGKRLTRARHMLIGYTDADGHPTIRPVELTPNGDHLDIAAEPLPPHRRAGVLAHWFQDHMIPQGSVILTGWLADNNTYAPHTLAGYEMPIDSDLAYELVSALTAKFGYRRAVADGIVQRGVWQR